MRCDSGVDPTVMVTVAKGHSAVLAFMMYSMCSVCGNRKWCVGLSQSCSGGHPVAGGSQWVFLEAC